MARITRSTLEACLDFGAAALAVAETVHLAADGQNSPAAHLLVELVAAHDKLRSAFDLERDDLVHALGLSVLVLADRTRRAIRESGDLTGS